MKDSKRAKVPVGELVGYARVSTTEQNLDLQIQQLTKFGCVRIFTDKLSASSKKREGWIDCRRYLRDGDTLVVYSLSRLARSVEELLRINKELIERGINLKSLTEPIDTRTADGRLIFNVRAALAQFERDVTVERTRAGIAARKKKGLFIGRPPKFTPERLRAIKRDLLARARGDYKYAVKEVMKMHKVSKQVLGYYFPGGRQNIKRK